MTTNKPDVVAWYTPTTRDTLPVVALNDRSQRGEPLIRLSDYEALQAERDHYKSATVEITTRHFTERWVNAASNKELEQYLSDGIAQLEGEYRKQIEALQAECEQLRRLLQRCEPVLIAHAGASHMTDGFRPRRNSWDELVEQIDAALHGGLP